ncbi:MAG: restriction endonuclease subunit S [Bacteroidetes bacterium]|nr:restriction endonuclease subunit S [Bacteroidota bacterium]
MPKRLQRNSRDWVVEKSGSVIKFFGGNAFSSDDACEEGIKWLKIANVGLEATKWNDVSFLPYNFIELHKKYLLKDGDVVMALTRPILDGKLKIAKVQKSDEPCLLNQRVAKLIPKGSVDISFLYYVLQTPYYVYMMDIAMAGTDPPNIGNGDLEKIKIPLPPLPEQKAIAQVFSTADAAIHTTEKLIAQKELRKNGSCSNC